MLSKILSATGQVGTFTGKVQIDSYTTQIQVHNPSTHDESTKNVKRWKVISSVDGAHHVYMTSQEITQEQDVLPTVANHEENLQAHLNYLSRHAESKSVEAKLKANGYQ